MFLQFDPGIILVLDVLFNKMYFADESVSINRNEESFKKLRLDMSVLA